MEFWRILLGAFVSLMVISCCFASGKNTARQANTSATIKPQRTALPLYTPRSRQPVNNNSLRATPLPSQTAAPSTTTYTNSIGIQLQVAPPVVVDMSPDAPLPAYTPNPTFQDIQFSSHPRPTIVTTIAEDPAPVPTTRE